MFEWIAQLVTYDLLGLEEGSKLAVAVWFFVYDVFKILILVFSVVSFIAFLRTFMSPAKLKKSMSKLRFGVGHLLAAIFGAVTPFCSCSSVPLFIGFVKARVPVGIAFSFLVTSPLVNEVAFVIMGGLFGWKLAFIYAISGILLGWTAGVVIGLLKMDKEIILDKDGGEEKRVEMQFKSGFRFRVRYAVRDGLKTLKKLYPYVIGGVALGAAIHGYVPQEFFTDYIGRYSWLSVPIAVVVGMPIYAGCSTVVPVIFSITANGVPLGTALAFLMAIAGLSLPEAVMLKRVLSFKLLAVFFGIVAVGIILIGYLFNFLTL